MANEPIRGLFGRIAVAKGYVTQAAIDEALRAQSQLGANAPNLGALLIQRFLVTPKQVAEIVELQKQYEARQAAAAGKPLEPIAEILPSGPARPVAAPAIPVPASMLPGASPSAAPAPARPAPAGEPASMKPTASGAALLAQLLEAGERKGASDVHCHGGAPLALRVEGKLAMLPQKLDPADQERMLLDILDASQRAALESGDEIDIAYVTPGGLRARANIYRSQNGLDGTFRLLRRSPESFEALGLPNALAKLASYHQGLVLVTGPAGSGKSTTLAALVDLVNEDRAEHVLTVEDPVEILHPVKKALVNQRQISRDTESYARALRGALREDPDVIVIGELRDRESISLAITAAQTGHLVIGTMQTNSATRTIARLVDAFPPTQHGQMRAQLAESLRGIVTQRLVTGVNGRRVPAVEVLFVTMAVANLIREGKLFQIRSIMQTGRTQGMRSLDDSLRELVQAGKVSQAEARVHAESAASIGAAPPPPAPAAPEPAGPPTVPPRGPVRMGGR